MKDIKEYITEYNDPLSEIDYDMRSLIVRLLSQFVTGKTDLDQDYANKDLVKRAKRLIFDLG